jgi:hypothetical protein
MVQVANDGLLGTMQAVSRSRLLAVRAEIGGNGWTQGLLAGPDKIHDKQRRRREIAGLVWLHSHGCTTAVVLNCRNDRNVAEYTRNRSPAVCEEHDRQLLELQGEKGRG